MSSLHDNFNVADSGLFIHSSNGFLGASPDGLVGCLCCNGQGVCMWSKGMLLVLSLKVYH